MVLGSLVIGFRDYGGGHRQVGWVDEVVHRGFLFCGEHVGSLSSNRLAFFRRSKLVVHWSQRLAPAYLERP